MTVDPSAAEPLTAGDVELAGEAGLVFGLTVGVPVTGRTLPMTAGLLFEL